MPYSNQFLAITADFRNFLYVVWKHLNLPDPTPVQYDIAAYLQAAYENDPEVGRRIVIEAFRGVGKSWITSAFVCWLLLKDPQLRILVVSASKERSDSFTVFTKRLISDIPLLMHLQAEPGQRDSSIMFDVGPAAPDHAPSVKSVGITGQMTGSRAHVIIADDVETPKNSLTQLQRERLGELVKEFDAILKPGGSIIYLGTPQTEESLYNILGQRGYRQRIWPVRYPGAKLVEAYGESLAPWILREVQEDPSKAGKPTDPLRFDDLDLIEREASYGRSGFALQFMLDTSLADADRYPLKVGDLIVMDLDKEVGPVKVTWGSGPQQILEDVPNVGLAGDRAHGPMFVSDEFTEYTGCVMAIDPSGRGGDELGYAVVKILHGRLFVMEATGLQGGYASKNLEFLAKECQKYGVNDVVIESNFGDGMFAKLFQPILARYHPAHIEEVRSSTRKELRIIEDLEPVLNQHRLVMDKRILSDDVSTEERDYQLFYQMTRLTKDKDSIRHDDRLDALAMAVRFWLDNMSRDDEMAAQEYQEEQLDAMLEDFMESVGFGSPGGSKWVDDII